MQFQILSVSAPSERSDRGFFRCFYLLQLLFSFWFPFRHFCDEVSWIAIVIYVVFRKIIIVFLVTLFLGK